MYPHTNPYDYFQQPSYFPYYYMSSYPSMVSSPGPFNYNQNFKESEKELDIEKMLNNIEETVKEQTSCRYLQKKLDEGDRKLIDRVFDQLIKSIKTYMNDPFGNYLCQKVFDLCTPKQIDVVIDNIAGHVVELATNLHGTRAIQKIIEKAVADPDLFKKVIKVLKTHVAEMVMDNNGNHVLQLCLTVIKYPYNNFIYTEIAESCLKIATHKHGCCVLQKCIDYATKAQRVMCSIRLGETYRGHSEVYKRTCKRSIWQLCSSIRH